MDGLGSALSGAVAIAGRPAAAGCAHCELPVASGETYCCYGCELAHAVQREASEDHSAHKARLTVALLLSMTVMMLSLFLYAEDIYLADGAGEDLAWMRAAYRWISLFLATPVMALCGVPLLARAARRLARGRLSMDALIATGAFTAWGLSLWSILSGGRDVYFDSATAAVALATLGRYLEATARAKASRVIGPALESTREPVQVIAEDGTEHPAHPAELRPGDRLRVEVERAVPVDLRLVGGPVEVDLGVLTGESEPVSRADGELVPAGAVPVSGPLTGVALRAARDSTLEQLAALARSLRERPSDALRAADRFAAALTPIVWAVAAGTLIYWASAAGFERGVVHALAVVLVACPCTYAIATPLVHWLALRRALLTGALIRSAETLEALSRVDTVAFDKTGTLTEPQPVVRDCVLSAPDEEVAALVRALEDGSRHPWARALSRWAEAESTSSASLAERRFETGRGVVGVDAVGRRVALGSPALLREAGVELPAGLVGLAVDGREWARFELGERARPEAKAAIQALRADGLRTLVLSGDATERAEALGRTLDVEVRAGLGPADKLAALEGLGARVAMVGDGLNDAPALASVGPSFSMEGGTGLARGLAQVSLLRADLELVPATLRLARRAARTARNLLGISTAYNLFFVALAAGGLLRPVFAGLSMLISSLLVLAVAATSVER